MLPKKKLKVTSEAQMLALGKELYQKFKLERPIVLIEGPIGAGKTVLIKGIVSAKTTDISMVTSPSFSYKNLYAFDTMNFYHYDFYLIKTFTQDFIANLLADKDDGLVLIEWANLYPKIYRVRPKVVITIKPIDQTTRQVTIKG